MGDSTDGEPEGVELPLRNLHYTKSHRTFAFKPFPFATMLFLYFIQHFLHSVQVILYHFAPSGNLAECYAMDFSAKKGLETAVLVPEKFH